MEMHRRNGGDNFWNHRLDRGLSMESSPPSKLFPNGSSDLLMHSSSACGGSSSVGDGGLGYIEHTVTKFDTLAGVAIKYGVEVADIKKMNGLTTDLQMFSRKTLHIPLPGRHPPSPIMSNGYDQGPKKTETPLSNRRHSDLFDSIKSLKLSSSSTRTVSPSMDALRDYYGLKSTNQNGLDERFKTDPYKRGGSLSLEHGRKPPQSPNPPHGLHRKCKSLAHELSETDHTPETMLKPETTNTTGAFSPAVGKGLALRPKAASRTASDSDALPPNLPPLKLGDSVITDASNGVKKSSSSPSFHDSYNNSNSSNGNYSINNNCTSTSSSIWPTSMLNLTADLQALSTAAITRPIFDGLPKPISGRKNKAAID